MLCSHQTLRRRTVCTASLRMLHILASASHIRIFDMRLGNQNSGTDQPLAFLIRSFGIAGAVAAEMVRIRAVVDGAAYEGLWEEANGAATTGPRVTGGERRPSTRRGSTNIDEI